LCSIHCQGLPERLAQRAVCTVPAGLRECSTPTGDCQRVRNSRVQRSELAALLLRVAKTLERSAQLAEDHAQRERNVGHPHSAALAGARRTSTRSGAAAQRGRAPAAHMR
jgi:hypothetical protein